jgi:hypothetical protein
MHKSYLYVLFLHIYALRMFWNVINCKYKIRKLFALYKSFKSIINSNLRAKKKGPPYGKSLYFIMIGYYLLAG